MGIRNASKPTVFLELVSEYIRTESMMPKKYVKINPQSAVSCWPKAWVSSTAGGTFPGNSDACRGHRVGARRLSSVQVLPKCLGPKRRLGWRGKDIRTPQSPQGNCRADSNGWKAQLSPDLGLRFILPRRAAGAHGLHHRLLLSKVVPPVAPDRAVLRGHQSAKVNVHARSSGAPRYLVKLQSTGGWRYFGDEVRI